MGIENQSFVWLSDFWVRLNGDTLNGDTLIGVIKKGKLFSLFEEVMMNKVQSFRISGVHWRDVPGFLVGYVILSVIAVLFGLATEALSAFWTGASLGLGSGLLLALSLVCCLSKKNVRILPEPLKSVLLKLEDPACTFPSRALAEAVKVYCDETGADLSEGTAVLKGILAERQS